METALIILLWIAIIAVVYYPVKEGCVAMVRKINVKKRMVWYGLLIGGLFLILSYPALLPNMFWKIFSLAVISLGFVVYPIAIAIFRWQNRNNPEALKQLNDRVNKSIANADKYGQ